MQYFSDFPNQPYLSLFLVSLNQRGETAGASAPPSRGIALLPFGGNKMAAKTNAITVMARTTNPLRSILPIAERM
jgi:hypothetical protein